MKRLLFAIAILATTNSCTKDQLHSIQSPAKETVMRTGMKICAENISQEICILAKSDLDREISFDSITRRVTLIPRKERWYGKLGLYFPGSGNHWENHKGITRCIVNESELHFKEMADLLVFVNDPSNLDKSVYRNDGLYVSWYTSVKTDQSSGGYLSLSIYQLLIDGEKPKAIPGSRDEMIMINYN
jgi:hypothetical protein